MILRFLFLIGAFLISACTQARLDGTVALGSEPVPEPPTEIVLLPDTLERIRAELVALGRAGTFTRIVERRGAITWRAGDGSAFVTRDGLVTSTFGLGFDLISADVSETRALMRAKRSGDAVRVHQYLDGENQVKTRAFQCVVALRERSASRSRMTEDCRGTNVSFQNSFTIGKGGAVTSSRQWLGPEVGYLHLTGGR